MSLLCVAETYIKNKKVPGADGAEGKAMSFMYFLAVLIGPLVKILYSFIGNYAATMIVATLILKLLLFPLSIHQQKSTAKMSLFQPLINEIQQKYKNEQAERQYQDTLRQQEFNNNVTSEKLNIAKGEWALKQSKAAQSAQQAAANAGAKSAGSSGGSGSGSVLSSGGSTIVPYSAARLYRQGRSDTAIRSELLREGYSNDEVANILKQLGS